MKSSMGCIRLGYLLGRRFGRLQLCCFLVLIDLKCEIEDTYAFKKPNVVNRPNEQPTIESQPARPSSGGMVSFFSVIPTFPSAGWPSSREVLSESDGMMKTVQNEKLKSEEDCSAILKGACLSIKRSQNGVYKAIYLLRTVLSIGMISPQTPTNSAKLQF